jgi:hypothetical protein
LPPTSPNLSALKGGEENHASTFVNPIATER